MKTRIVLCYYIVFSQACAPTVPTSTTTISPTTTAINTTGCCEWPFLVTGINSANVSYTACTNATIHYSCASTTTGGLATLIGNTSANGVALTNNQLIGSFNTSVETTLVCNLTTHYYNFILDGVTNYTYYQSYGCGYESSNVSG